MENLQMKTDVRKKRQLILAFLDILIVAICSILALLIRFDISNIPEMYIENLKKYVLYDIVIQILIFNFLHLYQSVWTFASFGEIVKIFIGTLSATIVEFICRGICNIPMPRSYFIIKLMLIFFTISLLRMSVRILKYYRNERNYIKSNKINTMIVGAGCAGDLLINELKGQKSSKNVVVCAIDDNINKKNKFIHGIPIAGNRYDIKENAIKYKIDEIIITLPAASGKDIRDITMICNQTGCKLRVLPSMATNLQKNLLNNLRNVTYEELLGREPVNISDKGIRKYIENKIILVTGGGGSIGSELCRQIMKKDPKQLIIFDIYENNAYDIQNELKQKYPHADVKVLIGSVRDIDRLDDVFNKYKPNIVYHAAAHKHVPLMEDSPNEAIKNNCLGTLNVAKIADKHNVDRFVLISTDKAVRPTNVMGASKRICEMIIQTFNKTSKTEFVAVRFGNVLGSNGSVIPLFLKQIENGGPVTVTHKEVTRFFMTIPEAVSLVLQAGAYAKGGEIFILDMGEQVKIYDLAYNLIKLKGLVPNEDINIAITGLRPGEKLYEEILMDEEGIQETENKLIHIGKPIEFDEKKFLKNLDKLIASAEDNSKNIKELVQKICDNYVITEGEQ